MTTYYKSYGMSASITEHRNGSVTLKTCCGKSKTKKKYTTKKSAERTWNRICS